MAAPTLQQLADSLTSQGLPTPSHAFLLPILNSASQRIPPLQALVATAKHRLLSADLTQPSIFSPTNGSFPANITDVRVVSAALSVDIPVQVLDIEDLSRSKWEQIEALESERKGETTKGREVIRVVPTPADGEAPSTASTQFPSAASAPAAQSKGPFKLLMQDCKGNSVYGFELKKVEKIAYPPVMSIGCKVLLRKGCKIARGMVLLEPGMVVVLGGKIDGLDKGWKEGREQRLRETVERERNTDE